VRRSSRDLEEGQIVGRWDRRRMDCFAERIGLRIAGNEKILNVGLIRELVFEWVRDADSRYCSLLPVLK